MYKKFPLLLGSMFLFFTSVLYAYENTEKEDKRFVHIIQQELMRNYEVLKKRDIPVYYMALKVERTSQNVITSLYGNVLDNSLGSLIDFSVLMRVGDRTLDNRHYTGNLSLPSFVDRMGKINEEAIKLFVWREIQQTYSEAIDKLKYNKAQQATQAKEEDKSPDFSVEKPSHYYEKPLDENYIGLEQSHAIAMVDTLSKILSDNKDVLIAQVNLSTSQERTYYIDTDGGVVVQNKPIVRLFINGSSMATDGMMLEDYKTYMGEKMSELPSIEQLKRDTRDMSRRLTNLAKAEKIDTYNGPVLLSAEVSGVFFHEFLGHRLEGARMKSGEDAQTLKKKVNEKVLPERISVIFDPTIDNYKGVSLHGNYQYDDEGMKGQRVVAIENGILKNFLMNRVPIDGFLHSNGHGRGEGSRGSESRQSNLIVESTNPLSENQLKARFIEEIKKKHLDYGYRIDKVSGGLTMTSASSANVFYLDPLVVYKVYVDGRPDELVRGIKIVGTPLVAFAQIIAEGDTHQTFNGMCGAASGSVPVSAIAPAMLIKELEFQKTGDSNRSALPILQRP